MGGAALAAAIVWASGADGRAIGEVIAAMIRDPWTVVALVDLYLGFFIAAVFIFAFERSFAARILWAAPVFFVGNVWAAAWLALRAPRIIARLRAGG